MQRLFSDIESKRSIGSVESKSLELMQSLVANPVHVIEIESKATEVKDDRVAELRKKRAEILQCIKIIKRVIRKRHRPIQITMLLAMGITAIIMIDQSRRYNQFKEQQAELDFRQLPLTNELSSLENIFAYLKKSVLEFWNIDFLNHHYFDLDCYWYHPFRNHQEWFGPCHQLIVSSNEPSLSCRYPGRDWDTNCPPGPPVYPCGEIGWRPCLPSAPVQWYTDTCGAIDIFNQTQYGCEAWFGQPSIYACFDLIKDHCFTLQNMTSIGMRISNVTSMIVNLGDFYEAVGGVAIYYLLSCGLGEVAPSVVIALTLLTHMFTNCLTSRFFSLSEDDEDEVLTAADKYAIEGDFSSYPKMLKSFQNSLPEVENKLALADRRQAFVMASRAEPEDTPLSLVWNDPIGEPKLAKMILDMACLTEDSQIFSASKPSRFTFFIIGSHLRNSQPDQIGRLNPLYSFFSRLQHETSTGEKYDEKQGKHSAEAVVNHIYEFAGFVPVKAGTMR